MRKFQNDYSELGHKDIIQALAKYSLEQNIPYGLDKHSENAERMIKKIFNSPQGKVFFLAGGTQTNMSFISYALRPHEAVISLDTGHINVHETGSVEGSGHKIITVKGENGKIRYQDVIKVMETFIDEHMVKPKMVYISNSTEIGTIYYKKELLELKKVCDKYNLYLFIDGARLASALTAKDNDVNYELLGEISDAFYIGGTKNGLLYGEALVINNPKLQDEFRYHIKNKGAMLAKGYGVGIQFEEAFKNNLYFELGKHSNMMSELIRNYFESKNIKMIKTSTNQVFAFFKKEQAKKIIDNFSTEIWMKNDDEYCLRFVCSFATTKEDVNELISFMEKNI